MSFATNTNWQGYGGEATMSYLTQMLGLAVQNFLSAATGMAVLVALIRGFARRAGRARSATSRSTSRAARSTSCCRCRWCWRICWCRRASCRTFEPYQTVELVEPLDIEVPVKDARRAVQDATGNPVTKASTVTSRPFRSGPAASQVAIKQLGTNGGGFFNVNSAHPFENPTPLTNFLEVLAILLIPAALCYTFGRMVGDTRQGWAMLVAMLVIFVPLTFGAYVAEQAGNPRLAALGADQTCRRTQSGGNMEGKEVRFGIANSALWATATTAASNGSVNAMHDSFTPLGGLVPMWLMQLGEVVFGGVGSGLYGMLMFAVVAVFIAGLMVGRTPEYLGKKIEAYEVKMASLVLLMPRAGGAGRHGHRERDARRARAASPIPARTASRRSSTRSLPPATTTAARLPGCPRTRPSTTSRSASRCGRRATG